MNEFYRKSSKKKLIVEWSPNWTIYYENKFEKFPGNRKAQ